MPAHDGNVETLIQRVSQLYILLTADPFMDWLWWPKVGPISPLGNPVQDQSSLTELAGFLCCFPFN